MIAAILCIRRNLSLGLPAMLQHIPVTHNSGFHNVKFHDTPIVLDINCVDVYSQYVQNKDESIMCYFCTYNMAIIWESTSFLSQILFYAAA